MAKTTRITVTAASWPRSATSSARPALLLSMDERPRAHPDLASRLVTARINIKCGYASTTGGGRAQVVVAIANPGKAERALD